ncbi:MAG: CPBP family intramembrane metalloprotease [Bacilli bacterium]|nr:CPBP family intramembrane metalloprotease [Bacilli bacterium]
MFKQTECPYCKNKFDDAYDECPYCHSQITKRTNKVSFIPFFKQIIIFAIGLFGFQLLGLIIGFLVGGISSLIITNSYQYEEFLKSLHYNALINFIAYAITFVGLVLTLWKDNFTLLKTFKHWTIPVSAIIAFVSIFIFNLIYGIILKSCGVIIKDNQNETMLTDIVKSYPILSILIFGLVGPICEEITYRVGLYSFLRRINKYLAYGITILVFAFIHFDFLSSDIVNEFLNLPYYLFAAFVFCFLYEKFGFASSVSTHIANNIFSIISTIVVAYNK